MERDVLANGDMQNKMVNQRLDLPRIHIITKVLILDKSMGPFRLRCRRPVRSRRRARLATTNRGASLEIKLPQERQGNKWLEYS